MAWPLLWLQICKEAKGQGQEVQAKGQRAEPQGRQTTRAAALYSPFLYSLSKSKPQPKVNAYSACNEQITVGTAVSPHGPGATNPVRNPPDGTGWWLGCLTISGLGTLTALQITKKKCNRLYDDATVCLLLVYSYRIEVLCCRRRHHQRSI